MPVRTGGQAVPGQAGLPVLHEAAELPKLLGFKPDEMKPSFKEGLALVNGANFSAAMLALGVHDAERLANTADSAAAITMEALCGCSRALDPKVHEERGHPGQIESAKRMRDETLLDFRARRVRLERLLLVSDYELAAQDVAILRALTDGQQGEYAQWLRTVAQEIKNHNVEKSQ